MQYLGYGITILSMVVYAAGLQLREEWQIIISQILAKILTVLCLLCFDSATGVWTSIVGFGVLTISYLREKYKRGFIPFYFIFETIYIYILVNTFDGISSILMFVGSSLSLLSLFWLREQPLRIVGLIKSCIYVVYQLSIKNWAGITELIIVYSYISSYIKYRKK